MTLTCGKNIEKSQYHFHLPDRTSWVPFSLARRRISLAPGNRTTVNVKPCLFRVWFRQVSSLFSVWIRQVSLYYTMLVILFYHFNFFFFFKVFKETRRLMTLKTTLSKQQLLEYRQLTVDTRSVKIWIHGNYHQVALLAVIFDTQDRMRYERILTGNNWTLSVNTYTIKPTFKDTAM